MSSKSDFLNADILMLSSNMLLDNNHHLFKLLFNNK